MRFSAGIATQAKYHEPGQQTVGQLWGPRASLLELSGAALTVFPLNDFIPGIEHILPDISFSKINFKSKFVCKIL